MIPTNSKTQGMVSLSEFIEKYKATSTPSPDQQNILRHIIRSAERSHNLYQSYSGTSLKAIKKSGTANQKQKYDFLEIVINRYEETKDPKILNGFLKIAANPSHSDQFDVPETLLQRAISHLHEVKYEDG